MIGGFLSETTFWSNPAMLGSLAEELSKFERLLEAMETGELSEIYFTDEGNGPGSELYRELFAS